MEIRQNDGETCDIINIIGQREKCYCVRFLRVHELRAEENMRYFHPLFSVYFQSHLSQIVRCHQRKETYTFPH